MKPSQWIDATDRLKLEAAAEALRIKTGAEVAVAIVANSCWNREIPWRIATGLASLTLVTMPLCAPQLAFGLLGLSTTVVFAAGFALGQIPRVQRNLQDSKTVSTRVHAHAQRIFSEAGLARATQKKGILFFVSLLEERTVVLADEGVALLDAAQKPWLHLSEKIGDGFRAGNPVPHLLAAIAECESLLAPRSDLPSNSKTKTNVSDAQNFSVLLLDTPER